jgi:hypothetical protein
MNGKQNFIFLLGLTLIILQFYLSGSWHILADSIYKGPANSASNSKPVTKNTPLTKALPKFLSEAFERAAGAWQIP